MTTKTLMTRLNRLERLAGADDDQDDGPIGIGELLGGRGAAMTISEVLLQIESAPPPPAGRPINVIDVDAEVSKVLATCEPPASEPPAKKWEWE